MSTISTIRCDHVSQIGHPHFSQRTMRTCYGCPPAPCLVTASGDSVKAARSLAREQGWQRVEGRDICFMHPEELDPVVVGDADKLEQSGDGDPEGAADAESGDLSPLGSGVRRVSSDAKELPGLGDADGEPAAQVIEVHRRSLA